MASVDAAWLHMDRPTNLMVVTCVFWFDRPLDWDQVGRPSPSGWSQPSPALRSESSSRR